MTQGGGRGFSKVSSDIFSKKLALLLHLVMMTIRTFLLEKLKSHITRLGGGGYGAMSQNDT
jgi:hypothetical protein